MDRLSTENESIGFQILEKHKYPVWIRVFFIFIILMFISVVPSFLLNELPYHCALSDKIKYAEASFLSQNHQEALRLYTEILEKHPNYEYGRMQAVNCCFILSAQNIDFYFKGLGLLGQKECTDLEIAKMTKFLPEKYQAHFKSLFTFKKKGAL